MVADLTMGESYFNQFMQLRNQLVKAAKNLARDEKLTPVLIPTTSKNMDEQLKLTDKVVDVADRANKKIVLTRLLYNVDKLESSYAQAQQFATKKNDQKFQQNIYVKYKLEEFIYLLDVMSFVNDNVFADKPVCNGPQIVTALNYSLSIFFLFESGRFGTLELLKTRFSSQNQKWDFIMLYLHFRKFFHKNPH